MNFLFSDDESIISNNMVSYLANREKLTKDNTIPTISFIFTCTTILNFVVTYLFIYFYLRFKHKKCINIAEKMNFSTTKNFVSFRIFIIGFVGFLCTCGFLNFWVHHTDLYQNINSVPPAMLLLNIFTVLFSLIFILKKRKFMSFLKRRLDASIFLRNKNNFRKSNKICPNLPKHAFVNNSTRF